MMFFTVSADHEAHHFCRKSPSVFPSVYGSIADAQLFGKLRLGQLRSLRSFRIASAKVICFTSLM